MRALVAGATGGTGGQIVRELVEKGIPVRAMVRDRAAADQFPDKVDIAVADVLEPESLAAATTGCTVLLCATGARPSLNPLGPFQVDFLGTRNLIAAAKAAAIEHFVIVSSLCVSQVFHPLNLFWLVLIWKKQAEAELMKSSLTYTIVRPGGLRTDDNAEPLVMSSADTLSDGSIARSRVARVCVESLTQPAAKNKIIEIVTSADATPTPWAELFAQVA